MPDTGNVFDKISSEYYQLTTAERKVADYVIAHHGIPVYVDLRSGEACGVAEATVSRFCRRLQYKGLQRFQTGGCQLHGPPRRTPRGGGAV